MKANKILIALSSIIYAALPCHAMEHKNALFAAIVEGNQDEVDSLFNQHQINIEAQTEDNDTPLLVSVQNGRVAIARLLLQRGANINAHCG